MKLLIVGGVAGGAAAAARARRLDEKAEIIIFERGEYISFANCGLPYYAGNVIKERDSLILQNPEGFSKRFNISVRINNEVIGINRADKKITVKDLKLNKEYFESYDKLILSPGAKPIIPNFSGVVPGDLYVVRNIPDIDKIKSKLDKNIKSVSIIGGGFIGLEMAENVIKLNIETHLIEKLDQVMPPFDKDMAVILQRELAHNGVKLHLNEEVENIEKNNNGFIIQTKSGSQIQSNMVICAIGIQPETGLFKKAGLETGVKGARVNNRMQTSDENIYAVGDVVETKNPITGEYWHVPLAWPAARQALVAVNNIFGIEDSYSGNYGASIVKVFSLTAASCGVSEKMLSKTNLKYEKIYTHPFSHAGYYPGASQLSFKIIYNKDSGIILGAQIIGQQGVDKYMDVLSMAIKHKLTMYDLSESDFCYAPPYSSAKNALNLAGMAAVNHLRGITKILHWENVSENDFLLDVRTTFEYKNGTVKNAHNIPIDDLRKRLNEIPKDKRILVFCQVGVRAHNSVRILVQNGFDAYNLSGGYKTYLNYRDSNSSSRSNKSNGSSSPDKEINACGLQCPGPIIKLKDTLNGMKDGETVKIISTDKGFIMDLPHWCKATNNTLLDIENNDNMIEAIILKGTGSTKLSKDIPLKNDRKSTIVIFSGELDKAMASFIIARSAAAVGRKVTMFFTFWGLNMLKKHDKPKVKKDILSKMFGSMMPRSISALSLSNLHMLGMGTSMMKYVMKKKNVESIETMLHEAKKDGIDLVACSMSMDVMGIHENELIDGIKIGGAAYYIGEIESSNHNLFI
ncbi:MAG: DsrE/DsrF/DrsH-like family protein [bacterium]|nr:DsrE/DsrF/DrsH-like family protein [bacterium]